MTDPTRASFTPAQLREPLRSACPICDLVLSARTEDELKTAHKEHLAKHLRDYLEEECEAGRWERVISDGKTLYREIARHERKVPHV